MKNIHKIRENIYLTSNEEIKEGDWFIRDGSIHKCFRIHKTDIEFLTSNDSVYCGSNTFWSKGFCKKIILTTDQELIKDGVQAIDDEFLEWFVKNPSCEEVEVAKTNKLIDLYADKEEDKWEVKYHIYIPKEEPDYTALLQPVGTSQEILLEEVFNDDKKENIKKFIDEINNPSQPNDKLKQAFEKYSEYLEDFENKNTYEHGFKDGAKCQQEISYSEEEVIAFGEFIFKHSLLTHTRGVKNLFEQFRKK